MNVRNLLGCRFTSDTRYSAKSLAALRKPDNQPLPFSLFAIESDQTTVLVGGGVVADGQALDSSLARAIRINKLHPRRQKRPVDLIKENEHPVAHNREPDQDVRAKMSY